MKRTLNLFVKTLSVIRIYKNIYITISINATINASYIYNIEHFRSISP